MATFGYLFASIALFAAAGLLFLLSGAILIQCIKYSSFTLVDLLLLIMCISFGGMVAMTAFEPLNKFKNGRRL